MANRFSRSSSRSSASRGFRFRRRGLKRPEPTQRWQAANFFTQQTITVDEGVATFIIAVEITKILNHLTEDTDPSLATKMGGAYRRLELGGIGFDSGFKQIDNDGESVTEPGFLMYHELLVIDALEPVDAFPVTAATFDWTRNQVPINTAPTSNDEDQDSAMRILWRHCYVENTRSGPGAFLTLNNGSPASQRTKNLRLRRFLDDRTGLYLIQQVTAQQAALTFSHDVIAWAGGTLYWRARMS